VEAFSVEGILCANVFCRRKFSLVIFLQGEAKNFGKADVLIVAPRKNKGK
jgi:hypothetical protein